MAYNAEKANQVYLELHKKGLDEGLCQVISSQMCTDWTSMRMLGYLRSNPCVKETEIIDEMLAILSDRDRIIQKKEMEYYQGKINELYNSEWT